jgi:hypothetical protein
VTNLFDYDYEIIYKKGKENVVVDALSRKYEEDGPFSPTPSLYQIGCKTQKFLACSTNCNTNVQFLQGTLGIIKSFATKFVCIYASNTNLNP